MSLSKYTEKRDVTKSLEPEGKIKKKSHSLAFVVQRHKASRLHYDFRMEVNGVLKSWAIPKGPSMNPKDKRLAMMVEDHPYEYKNFEGVIPEGYGAGIVEIWDKGKFSVSKKVNNLKTEEIISAGLKSGSVKFILHGKKLKGEFSLIKLKSKSDNSWLLIKSSDEYAILNHYDSEDFVSKNSANNKILSKKGGKQQSKSKGKEVPLKNQTKRPKLFLNLSYDVPYS